MDYVSLGTTGLKVSRICLGMMSYGDPTWRSWVTLESDGRPIIQRALEAGINFLDTADGYSLGVSEQITGRAVRDFVAHRDDVVIATKVFFPHSDQPNRGGLSRKHIFTAIDRSLKNLNMDYVDLYQIHRFDPTTPIEETLEALHDVVKMGKARYLGASSMRTYQFVKMVYTQKLNHWTPFISMQNHYNLIYREEEREMLPFCHEEGIGVIPWSPLARGFLAGTRTREGERLTERARTDPLADRYHFDQVDFDILDRVKTLAGQHSATPAQIALAWMLHQPAVTAPIIGAGKMAYLEDALGALTIPLSPEEITFLEELYQARPSTTLA